jgi:hypothetical protein
LGPNYARTTLRRAVPSFTVEVRRRPRLATTSNQNGISSETQPSKVAFDPEAHRAAAAAFASQQMDGSPVVAASHPRGRILPSLVPDEPWHRLLDDASVSAADSEPPLRASKRPSVRAFKRGEQAAKPPQNSSLSSEGNVSSAERPSTKPQRTSRMQSYQGVSAAPREPTRAPSQVAGGSRELAQSSKGGKRTILARYVFGGEEKPGARWKRRLLRPG